MLILAFESSARAASVALVRDGRLISQYSQCSGLTHSRTLLPMAEDMLKNAELSLAEVELLAVAQGPGSFTGIRIGVSTVKGLAWAGNKPCTGVSTLEALAWHGLDAGGCICPVMDARRGQVYNALFQAEKDGPRRLVGDRAISLSQLETELRALPEPAYLLGDGAELAESYLRERGVECRIARENLRFQSAWGVAMAAMGKELGTADSLLPVYLRLSQAERERQARMGQ